MTNSLFILYKKLLVILSLPLLLAEFFSPQTGIHYRLGFLKKIELLFKIVRNYLSIKSATSFLEHIIMVTRILNIPKSLPGVIVECGSYKGASTANLSLAAALTHRTLEVFDSFSGLPKPTQSDKKHILLDLNQIHTYSPGFWRGTLKEVKTNIAKYGRIDVCNFHKGYFAKTLPNFKKECVFIFLDVDFKKSYEDCLQNLWPLLVNNCSLFIHEAHHLEIVSLFYDKSWWRTNFHARPPYLVGAGSGLGLSPVNRYFGSEIAYTIKNPTLKNFARINLQG